MRAFTRRVPAVAMPQACAALVVAPAQQRRAFQFDNYREASLDRQVADKASKGPKAAHPLPVFKPMGKLHSGARWKSANVVPHATDAPSKPKEASSLAASHQEGRTDVTGHYRDWAHGEDRRFGNYMGVTLFCVAGSVFAYTVTSLRSDTWEVPEPLLMQPPPVAAKAGAGDGKVPLLKDAPSVAGRRA